ncbi:hypothetical protein [Rhizobium mesosinicum]|uniref:Uncharacterized protein n=1 Tax=Rhizobium mesosinicum TaxID=335017 RepID=A0ABS7GQJ7_9HYPH|nr:hypothetical protein [Rhizobium mesosinicum]MBW9052214.1 hypothetical protein [Rhizobium mesosinicum]
MLQKVQQPVVDFTPYGDSYQRLNPHLSGQTRGFESRMTSALSGKSGDDSIVIDMRRQKLTMMIDSLKSLRSSIEDRPWIEKAIAEAEAQLESPIPCRH